MGVWLKTIISVKDNLHIFLWESAENGGVYAGFSPVQAVSESAKVQPLVAWSNEYNYILCFSSFLGCFPIRHIFVGCGILHHGFTAERAVVCGSNRDLREDAGGRHNRDLTLSEELLKTSAPLKYD